MKQILQSLRSGAVTIAETPVPQASPGSVLIRSHASLISSGTERMLVEFGQANWIDKARKQPDKVRDVLAKMRTDGIVPALEAVQRKLDTPLTLGYCNVGTVIGVGEGVSGFAIGDRVASNGSHAEVVSVPANLCARVPAGVSDESAAFTVIGAIALQGVRLAQPTMGERVAVIGLGLIGLLAVQLLRAQGCRVLGIDLVPARLDLARQCGAEVVNLAAGEDPIAAAERFTNGAGVDAVLVAAATQSSEPFRQAARMSRKRGRIVLVGVADITLSRADFYEKELTFQVSCSYGPGRYDPQYEQKGRDYPLGFVRWTAQRNFEALLDLMADGRVSMEPLISHRFAISEAEAAYQLITSDTPSLGVVLQYDFSSALQADRAVPVSTAPRATGTSVSFIGAGNYARGFLMPAFAAAGARLRMVASRQGASGVHAASKYGFESATTDTAAVFADRDCTAVVIATRHDTHGAFAIEGLRAGKHLFVEKPLCLSMPELERIEAATADENCPLLMVGFNRRFAPHIVKIRSLLSSAPGPKAFVMTVNAGAIPRDHWTQDMDTGGGRIAGEVCHFIDLLRHLAGARIEGWSHAAMSAASADTATIGLTFADGSIGTIHYFSNGDKRFPKERLEVFAAGRVLQLDNYRVLTGYGWPGFSRMRLWSQDKGQKACAREFCNAIRTGGVSPIPADEIIEVARVTIAIAGELRQHA